MFYESRSGVSLTGKKKVFRYQFSQKSPALHVLNHGWWQLAVGGWRRLAVGSWLLAVGGGWRRLVAGGWWLEAVGSGWQLAVGRRWRLAAVGGWRLVVGGWWRLAVDGSWRLAVGGPLGRSLRAVLSKKKKKSRPLRTPLVPLGMRWKMCSHLPGRRPRAPLPGQGDSFGNFVVLPLRPAPSLQAACGEQTASTGFTNVPCTTP